MQGAQLNQTPKTCPLACHSFSSVRNITAATDSLSFFLIEQMASSLHPKALTASPLSINQLLRLHCRERLAVHPVEWTHRHLELLECSFGWPTPEPASGCPDALLSPDKQLEEDANARFVRQLASRRGRGAQDFAWREAQLGRILTSDEHLSIHYR